MSNQLPSLPDQQPDELIRSAPPQAPAPYAAGSPPAAEPALNWRRYVSALLRYKWLILLVALLGTAAGVGISRLLPAQYWASATIWIENPAPEAARGGPIRSGQLLGSQAWVELLRSYAVLGHVAREQRLFLTASGSDTVVTSSLRLQEKVTPGAYRLTVDPTGRSFELALQNGPTLQRGEVGEPIGVEQGFLWTPPPAVLTPGRTVEFTVTSPSDVVRDLSKKLVARLDVSGNFLSIELTGRDREQVTATVNAVAERFIQVAAELKRAELEELTKILEEQLRYAEGNLRDAEATLENFRVSTVTLPSDRDAFPVLPGLQRDPAFTTFFTMRIEREQLRHDRESIQRALAEARQGRLPVNALEVVPSVQASSELRAALTELTAKQAELRALQYQYTDEHREVRRLQEQVATLERQTIPSLLGSLYGQLGTREAELAERVQTASSELQRIPTRTIEEARLVRRVAVAENLYTMLRQRYEESRLAAASSIPDVRILDPARPAQRPFNETQRQRIILLALVGSLGLAVVGAILLDRADPRLRYPEQVTHEMGLPILGAIPQVQSSKGRLQAENSAQIIEAFREIRLGLAHMHGGAGPLLLTVTSPGAGDGKSFVTSNLALAFADLGHRTLLIDGDIRQGGLHRLFERVRRPGLTDFLAGNVPLERIIQRTASPALDLIACGTRMQDGPELLGTPVMAQLIAELRSEYDVILVDSAPLGAGVDPFALGTVTGNLLLVVRHATTDRTLAETKLDLIDRLPIRVLGAVLNDVRPRGMYRYYSYLPGYESQDEAGPERETQAVAGEGETRELQGV